jgi:hypothetical protein
MRSRSRKDGTHVGTAPTCERAVACKNEELGAPMPFVTCPCDDCGGLLVMLVPARLELECSVCRHPYRVIAPLPLPLAIAKLQSK